jgi:hypothetical protein
MGGHAPGPSGVTHLDGQSNKRSEYWLIHGSRLAALIRWIKGEVIPILLGVLKRDGLQANLFLAGSENEQLVLDYEPVKVGSGYAASAIQLEFGSRATGEPHERHSITCDLAPIIDEVSFPTARPLVMAIERTFWEKATAAHALAAIERDYAAMLEDGLLSTHQPSFEEVIGTCAELESRINQRLASARQAGD